MGGGGAGRKKGRQPGSQPRSGVSKTPGTPLLPHEVTSRSLLAPFLNLRRIWATNFSLSNNFTENKSTYATLLKSLLRFYVTGQRAVARSPSLAFALYILKSVALPTWQ